MDVDVKNIVMSHLQAGVHVVIKASILIAMNVVEGNEGTDERNGSRRC